MTRIGDSYRLVLTDIGFGKVTLASSLEEQVSAIHAAALKTAENSNGTVHTYKGRPGISAQFAMSRLVSALFPEAGEREAEVLSDMARQVLKKLGAAHCEDAGMPNQDRPERVTPTWWVAFDLPADFVAVAAYVSVNGRRAQELAVIREEAHKRKGSRVTEKETAQRDPAGQPASQLDPTLPTETEPASQLEASQPEPKASDGGPKWDRDSAAKARELAAAVRAAKSAEYREEVFEIVRQASEPVTPQEVHTQVKLRTAPDGASSTRQMLNDLVDAGKLFRRAETAADRQARQSTGHPANLYWDSDPVPARKSKTVFGRRRASEKLPRVPRKPYTRDELADQVLSWFADNPGAHVSANELARTIRRRSENVRLALVYLADNGLVAKDGREWYCLDGCAPTAVTEPELPGEKLIVTAPSDPAAGDPVAPTPVTSRDQRVESIMALVREIAQGSPEETEALTARVAELEAENEKLKRANTALTRALSALQE